MIYAYIIYSTEIANIVFYITLYFMTYFNICTIFIYNMIYIKYDMHQIIFYNILLYITCHLYIIIYFYLYFL